MNIDTESYDKWSLHNLQIHYKYLNAHRHKKGSIKVRITLPISYTKDGEDGDRVSIPMSEDFYDEVINLAVEDIKRRQEKLKDIFTDKLEDENERT